MTAEIIAVGTELLMGQIANTNAQYLSERLSSLGVNVYYHTVCGDNGKRLTAAIETATGRSDIIVFTGGLGPTDDDLTKETVADYFSLPLEVNEDAKANIIRIFSEREMPASNLKQAYVPKTSKVLINSCGTAPGIILEQRRIVCILLPGPPVEMKTMFNEYIADYFYGLSKRRLHSKVLRFYGIGESALHEALGKDILDNSNPTAALYAKEGEVTCRITANAAETEAAQLIENMKQRILDIAGEYFYGEGDDNSLAKVVSERLIERGVKIAVAESCTGGLLSKMITDCPGISSVFMEGFVTYTNASKTARLGVDRKTLEDHGAVSAEVALKMAIGVRKNSGADIGVSTTGIAGPGGKTYTKPVGLCFVAVATENGARSVELNLNGSREKIRHSASMAALNLILKECK